MKLTAIYFKNILPSNITPKTFKRKYNIIQMIKMRIALRLLIFWTIMENAPPPPKFWNPPQKVNILKLSVKFRL